MFAPPVTDGGDPLLVTATSATVVATVAVDDAELFAVFESAVVLLTFAVFVIVEPDIALLLARTTIVKLPLEPAANVVKEQLTVPVPPAGGFVQAATGPEFCVSETNVVLAGTASVMTTFCASLVPLFVTTTVYDSVPPAAAAGGPVLVIDTSAVAVAVAFVVAELFVGFGSVVALDTLAVFVIVAPLARLGGV